MNFQFALIFCGILFYVEADNPSPVTKPEIRVTRQSSSSSSSASSSSSSGGNGNGFAISGSAAGIGGRSATANPRNNQYAGNNNLRNSGRIGSNSGAGFQRNNNGGGYGGYGGGSSGGYGDGNNGGAYGVGNGGAYGVPNDDNNYDYGDDQRATPVATPTPVPVAQEQPAQGQNGQLLSREAARNLINQAIARNNDYVILKDVINNYLGNEYAVVNDGVGKNYILTNNDNTHALIKEAVPDKVLLQQDYAVLPQQELGGDYVIVKDAIPKTKTILRTSGQPRTSSAVIGLKASAVRRPETNTGVRGFVRNLFGGYPDFRNTLSGFFIPPTQPPRIKLVNLAVPVVL